MGINIKQDGDGSAKLTGVDGGSGEFVLVTMPYSAIVNTSGAFLTCSSQVFSRKMIVKSIIGCPDTLTSNAVTVSVFKAPSATALGSGTVLHTGSFNPNSGAATNQTLTLTAAAVEVAAGSRIGFVMSATPGAAGVGVITVAMSPA